MWNQVPLIIRSFKKHKGALLLLVSLIALTIAVFANSASLIGEVMEKSWISTGIDERNIGVIQDIAIIGQGSGRSTKDKLARIRSLPSVAYAALGAIPLFNRNTIDISANRDSSNSVNINYFEGSDGYENSLGLKVTSGSHLDDQASPDFGANISMVPALITNTLANRLFGQASALGKTIYSGNLTFQVVGVVSVLRENLKTSDSEAYAMVVQRRLAQQEFGGMFVIRSRDGQIHRAVAEAVNVFRNLDPYHVQPLVGTFEEMKAKALSKRLALAKILSLLLIVLTTVTCFTIGSITSLWVRQRQIQIGIRRALGATRHDILAYFLLENGLITLAGVFIGIALAIFINHEAQNHFDIDGMLPQYVMYSVLIIAIFSLISALGPAWRASKLAPARAVRNI